MLANGPHLDKRNENLMDKEEEKRKANIIFFSYPQRKNYCWYQYIVLLLLLSGHTNLKGKKIPVTYHSKKRTTIKHSKLKIGSFNYFVSK